MMFTDRSSATASALQQAFAIEHEVALRLLSQAPVVVKRAASPDVAAVLLDALQSLGAQVVLLPSAAQGAPAAVDAGGARETPKWGALDLEPAPARAAGAREPEPRAASIPIAATGGWQEGLELDLGSDADAAASSAPIQLDRRESWADRVLAPSEPPEELEWEGMEVPALDDAPSQLPGLQASSGADAGPATARALFVPRSLAPEPAIGMRRVAPAEMGDDLGLGSVPPLPEVGVALGPATARARPPVPAAPPARSPPARAPLRVAPLPAPASRAVAAPRPKAAPPARGPAPRVADRTSGGLRLPEIAPLGGASPSGRGGAGEATRASAFRPAEEAAAIHAEAPSSLSAQSAPAPSQAPRASSRSLAMLELLAGGALLYLGVRMDNSVLYGNATHLSLLLHGFAFYGVGAGIAGLWR